MQGGGVEPGGVRLIYTRKTSECLFLLRVGRHQSEDSWRNRNKMVEKRRRWRLAVSGGSAAVRSRTEIYCVKNNPEHIDELKLGPTQL